MKNILITGASTGIGKACALHAANLGFKVYAGCRKDTDRKTLAELHKNIESVILDVCNDSDIHTIFEKIKNTDGVLDCLFNNAGIAYSGTNEFLSFDKFEHTFAINVYGPVKITQIFLPLIRRSNDPRILYTGSAAGLLPNQ